MPLFLMQHEHRDETCPASNAQMAQGLAGHIAPENAGRFGVRVLSDCVLPGEHKLLMVMEAERPDQVASFATPFMQAGSVKIQPVINCEVVAERASDA
jgi:hypothetical protein